MARLLRRLHRLHRALGSVLCVLMASWFLSGAVMTFAGFPYYLPRARLLQWHGTEPGGRDHRSLRHYPGHRARELLSRLVAAQFDGVLTLEVFDAEELASSEQVLEQLWAELGLAPRCSAGKEAP